MRPRLITALALTAGATIAMWGCEQTQPIQYPQTRTVDQVDDYHGTQVADPYRWLENDTASDVTDWVEAENAVTFAYLDQIPFRDQLRQRLEELMDYPRYSAPARRGDYYFFSKNDGLQNQSVIYVQEGLDGEPRVLLDPNTFSDDGTTTLSAFSPSSDGRYVVYGQSVGGSDWSEYHVMEVATGETLPDVVEWVKVSDAAWAGDGFFYSRYPAPAPGQELTAVNENHKVYFHRVGTAQADDQLVYEDPEHPQRFNIVGTTEDERYAILTVADRGTGKDGNAVFYRDLTRPGNDFRPLIPDITDDTYNVMEPVDGAFLVQTNHGAPNGRVVRIPMANPGESNWTDVLPERTNALQSAGTGGGKLFATYLEDVATHAYVSDLDGSNQNEIALPGAGAAGGFGGLSDDAQVFYTYTSFNYPPTIFQYDIASGESTEFRSAKVNGFDPEDYEVKQVFATSKDGTRIPMFLTYRKGLELNGDNPTLLTGYGGFDISLTPSFSPTRVALLENGFVFAQANLRGGGEYGEAWHEAGMKLNKQNVFDDFIACAEWLFANDYTNSERLAIGGDPMAACSWARSRISARIWPKSWWPRPASWTCSASRSGPSAGIGSPTTAPATTPNNSRPSTRTRRCTTSTRAPIIPRCSSPRRITTTAWCRPTRSSTPRPCRRPRPTTIPS